MKKNNVCLFLIGILVFSNNNVCVVNGTDNVTLSQNDVVEETPYRIYNNYASYPLVATSTSLNVTPGGNASYFVFESRNNGYNIYVSSLTNRTNNLLYFNGNNIEIKDNSYRNEMASLFSVENNNGVFYIRNPLTNHLMGASNGGYSNVIDKGSDTSALSRWTITSPDIIEGRTLSNIDGLKNKTYYKNSKYGVRRHVQTTQYDYYSSTYYTMMFKYIKGVSLPDKQITYIDLEPGQSHQFNIRVDYEYTRSYRSFLSSSVNNSLSLTASIGFPIKFVNVNFGVEYRYSSNASFNSIYQTSEVYKITSTINEVISNNSNTKRKYSLQTRAVYDVYTYYQFKKVNDAYICLEEGVFLKLNQMGSKFIVPEITTYEYNDMDYENIENKNIKNSLSTYYF